MEKQRALPELNPAQRFRHIRVGQGGTRRGGGGGIGWAQEGAHSSTAPGWHAHIDPGARGAASHELHPPHEL